MNHNNLNYGLVGRIAVALAVTLLFQNCAGEYNPNTYNGSSSSTSPPNNPMPCTVPAGTSWVAGGLTCTSDVAVTISDGGQAPLNDTVAPDTGTIQYACHAGQFAAVGAGTCTAMSTTTSCTIPVGTKWVDAATGKNTCTSTAPITIASGSTGLVSASTGAFTGSVSFLCSGGTPTEIVATGSCSSSVRVSVGASTAILSAHSCAIKADGTAECWGSNADGEIGNNSTSTTVAAPTTVSTALKFSKISAGGNTTCGVTTAGAVYCWGLNSSGEAGVGTYSAATLTVSPATVLTPTLVSMPAAVDVQVGSYFACALLSSGTVYCWGSNFESVLGNASAALSLSTSPVLVPGLSNVTSISVSNGSPNPRQGALDSRACAVTSAGTAYCWGYNPPATSAGAAITALTEVDSGNKFTQISTGDSFNCGLTTAGAVLCWGDESYSETASGVVAGFTATSINVGLSGVVEISSGPEQTCAIYGPARNVACWGLNYIPSFTLGGGMGGSITTAAIFSGQLGVDPNVAANQILTSPKAMSVAGAPIGAVEHISVGLLHTCLSFTNGSVQCLGDNSLGELGSTAVTASYTPVTVPLK